MGKRMKRTPEELRERQRSVYGSGSIYWITSRKCWELKKTVGTAVRKELRTQGKTKKECYDKMRVKEAEFLKNQGIVNKDSDNKNITVQDAMYEWLYTFKQVGLKEKSFDTCMGTFNNQILDSVIGKANFGEINDNLIQKYLNDLAERYSKSTVKKTYSLLNQFFSYWYRMNYHQNPMLAVMVPKRRERQPEFDENNMEKGHIFALSDEEIDKLTKELEKPFNAGKQGYKYGYMLLFILWSYMRIGEVLALTWNDVDFAGKKVRIDKALSRTQKRDKDGRLIKGVNRTLSSPKTISSRRIIPLSPQALRYLSLYHDNVSKDDSPEALVFSTATGRYVSEQQLHRNLATACDRAGIPQISIHGLRHTGISYFLRHGVDIKVVSKLAGHSDVTITMGIYYNLVKEQLENPYAKFFRDIIASTDETAN